MNVHRTRAAGVIETPHILQQLVTRERPARVLREKREERIFQIRKINWLSRDSHLVCRKIDRHFLDADEIIVANQDGKNSPNREHRFEYRSGSIEDDMPVIDEGIDNLLSVYAETAMRIRKAIDDGDSDDDDDKEIDEPVLRQMLVNITRLLNTSEVLEAEKVMKELSGCSFRRKPLKETMTQVIEAIEDYDTDRAQELIKIFIDKGYSM